MMNRKVIWAAFLLLLGVSSAAIAQQAVTLYGKDRKVIELANPLPVQIESGGGIATVAIDQTTPGTTNGVVVNSGSLVLGAGTALMGKTGIDQTTPGTTNGVVVNSGTVVLGAGSALAGKVGIDQTTPGTTNAVVVTGNVASAAADSGNPAKVGGVYNSAVPAFSTGQRGDAQLDVSGSLRVRLLGSGVTAADAVGNTSVSSVMFATDQGATINRPMTSAPYKYNGSTWDRDFTCPSTAVVSVTAGNTTQLVALSGTTTIRVCSFVLTESIAGTAQFVYGTGSNCGTGTTNITGAMAIATSDNISLAASGGSLFRGISANALCLAAVTGNIVGFVTYAQF